MDDFEEARWIGDLARDLIAEIEETKEKVVSLCEYRAKRRLAEPWEGFKPAAKSGTREQSGAGRLAQVVAMHPDEVPG